MIFLIYVLSSQISWKLMRKLLAITRLELEFRSFRVILIGIIQVTNTNTDSLV